MIIVNFEKNPNSVGDVVGFVPSLITFAIDV